LGNFEVDSPDNLTLPFNCNDDCVLESVGDHAVVVSSALGDWLTEMLTELRDLP